VRVAALVVVAGACLLGQAWWGRQTGAASASGQAASLPAGEAAAWLALGGLRAVAVSATWVRLLDAYDAGEYHEVPALASVLTALDPLLDEAWVVAAWTLAVNIPSYQPEAEASWPWVRQGLLHLRQGADRNPDAWTLSFNEGVLVMSHVRTNPVHAANLVDDRTLNPRGLPPVAYALDRFERAAAKPSHPTAVDWARLGALTLMAEETSGEARTAALTAAERVIGHVRRDHPETSRKALSHWQEHVGGLRRAR
jgi:hypothetical protein